MILLLRVMDKFICRRVVREPPKSSLEASEHRRLSKIGDLLERYAFVLTKWLDQVVSTTSKRDISSLHVVLY